MRKRFLEMLFYIYIYIYIEFLSEILFQMNEDNFDILIFII